MDLKDEWIEKLKCASCNNYLSHFPVYTTTTNNAQSEAENVCGRCQVPEETCVRNHIYETVAENISYPCRFEDADCREKLPPKDIPEHELQCPYRPGRCLTSKFTKCRTKVNKVNMVKHCQEEHAEHFLKDVGFEIDVTKSQQYNYIAEFEKELVILRCQFDRQQKLLAVTLSRRLYYKLRFTCGTRTLPFKCNNADEEDTQEIFLDSLVSPETSKISVRILLKDTVNLSTTEKDTHEEVSNFRKCSSCSTYVPSDKWCFICPKCQQDLYPKIVPFTQQTK